MTENLRVGASSIRFRLLLVLVVFALLCSVLVGSVSLHVIYQHGRELAAGQLRAAAISKEEGIRSWVRNLESELSYLLLDPELVHELRWSALGYTAGENIDLKNREALRGRLREYARAFLWLEELFVLDTNGHVVVAMDASREGQYQGLHRYFRAGMKRPGTHVQTRAFSEVNGGFNTVVTVRPIRSPEGAAVGVLCGRASLYRLNEIMTIANELGPSGEAYIVGGNSILLTRVSAAGFSAGQAVLDSAAIRKVVGERTNCTVFDRDYRGVSTIAECRWLPFLEIAIVAQQDLKEALRPIHAAMLQHIAVIAASCILAAVLALFIAANLVRPLRRLAHASESLAAGDFTGPVGVERNDEIGVLAQAFNTMAERLQKSMEQLRAGEARFRTIFESVSDALLLIDPEKGIVTNMNRRVTEVYGYTFDDIGSLTYQDLEEASAGPGRLPQIRSVVASPEDNDQTFECLARHKDGQTFWAEVTLRTATFGPNVRVLAAVRDITTRRAAERQLRESEERFHQLAEHIDSVFWMVDWNTNALEYVSPQYEKVWARSPESARNEMRQWCLHVHPEERDRVRQSFANTARSGEWLEEYRILRPDGQVRWIRDRGFPVRDDSGVVYRTAGLAEDITERKAEEARQRRNEERLRHTQKLESLGIMAGGIAHDFNNLLMAIIGNADLVLEDLPDNSPLRSYIRDISSAAQNAAGLCRQMLAYSGKGTLLPQPLDLSQLIRSQDRILAAAMPPNAALSYQLADALPPVEADPSQMGQLVVNLVTNAGESLDETGGTVRVETGQVHCTAQMLAQLDVADEALPGNFVYLRVADTGHGMPPELRARIFEPFFTTKFLGRGLGLSAVLGIVRVHGGALHVTSEVGRGTLCEVFLPQIPAAVGQDCTLADTCAESAWRGHGTILVIDDEQTVRAVAERMIRRLGFSPLLAANGAEGIKTLNQHADKIVGVLLDQTMPGMTGTEALREIRRHAPNLPVIVSSGYSSEDLAARYGKDSPDEFIQKPYMLAKLRDILRRLLGDCPKTAEHGLQS